MVVFGLLASKRSPWTTIIEGKREDLFFKDRASNVRG